MGSGPLASVGSFLLSLFGIRTITQNFVPVDDEPYLEFDPNYFTVTNDGANQRNIVTGAGAGSSPTFGNITVTSITYAPGVDVTGPAVRLTTTDAAAHTIATIAVPASSLLLVEFTVLASLGVANGVANLNAPNAAGIWKSAVCLARIGTGSVGVVSPIVAALTGNNSPFLPLATSSATGNVAIVAGATSAAIQVNGFSPKEAWTSGHTYTRGDGSTTAGDFVTASGNVYVCTTSGTASGSAPSGTGEGLGTGAKFDYVAAGTLVPVQWTLGAPRRITG